MKSKIKIMVIAAFTLFFVNLSAQTPESVLKSCPKVPSAETLKQWATSNCGVGDPYAKAREEVYSFQNQLNANIDLVREKINRINEEYQIALEKANAADKKAGKATGKKTFDDMDNMSQDEIMAMAMNMLGSESLNVKNIMKITELTDEMQDLAKKNYEEGVRSAKETDALINKHQAMLKPKGKYEKTRVVLQKYNSMGGELSEKELAELNRLCSEYKSLSASYYDEIIPEWLKHLETLKATAKKVKANNERLVTIQKEVNLMATSASGISNASTAGVEAEYEMKLVQWESLLEELKIMRKCTEFVKP